MTVKPCNRPAVGGHRSGEMKFIDVFLFILSHVSLVLFCLGSAEADANLNGPLMTSGVRNVRTKNY